MSATPVTPNAGAPAPAAPRGISVPDWVRGIRPGVALAGLLVAFFVVAMIVPSLLASGDPNAVNLNAVLQSPSLEHIMGTETLSNAQRAAILSGNAAKLLRIKEL